jgi:hypothetical protein
VDVLALIVILLDVLVSRPLASTGLSVLRADVEGHRSHRAADRCLPAGRQVQQILDHLALPTAAPRLRAPPDRPDAQAADPPREWSSEPLG